MAVKLGMNYTEADARTIRDARIGDVIVLDGHRVRLTKKTSNAVAVEPYGIMQRLEDWLLKHVERFLP